MITLTLTLNGSKTQTHEAVKENPNYKEEIKQVNKMESNTVLDWDCDEAKG